MQKQKHDIISSIYISIALIMIFIQLSNYSATIIDGIITSRFYGRDAYSGISLLSPLLNILVMLCGLISGGCQVLCAKKSGEGDTLTINTIFSTAILSGFFIVTAFIIACLLIPDAMFRLCGVKIDKHPEMYHFMGPYLKGYLFGAPAIMLSQIVSPIIVIDNRKKLVSLSAFVMCLVDIIGDLVNVLIFDGGTFGMGLATAISCNIQFLILLSHFVRKDCHYYFSLAGVSLKHLKDIASNGLPDVVKRIAAITKNIFINRFNIMLAMSTAAVAARGLQTDIVLIIFAIGTGLQRTALPMASLYYGSEDVHGLKRLFKVMVKYSTALSIIVGGMVFILAKPIIHIYSRDPAVVELAVYSIRCMAAVMVFDSINTAMMGYLQGIQRKFTCTVWVFCERFFVPVITAIIMGLLMGSKGILASQAFSHVILTLGLFIYICIYNKGLPKKLDDFLLLPKNFGGVENDNLYITINSLEDVMAASNQMMDFAQKHQIDPKRSNHLALFVEELGKNAVMHGQSKNRSKCVVEMRVHICGDNISLTIKDNFTKFNPVDYYKESAIDTHDQNGLKLVIKLAKDVKYINTFNTNNVIISL